MAKSDESKRTLSADRAVDDREYDITLRPSRFDEFIGQTKLKENLRVYVEAARRRRGARSLQWISRRGVCGGKSRLVPCGTSAARTRQRRRDRCRSVVPS